MLFFSIYSIILSIYNTVIISLQNEKGYYNMTYKLTEQKVLKKLGISDFRHLTKAKVINLASMLENMDPEVAKKALDQFPDFSKVSKELLLEFNDTLKKGLESNDKSMQNVYNVYNSIIISLQKELENENLSFEQKKYIIEKMNDIADKIGKKDSENKKWLTVMSFIAGAAAVGITALLASTLGANTHVESLDSND